MNDLKDIPKEYDRHLEECVRTTEEKVFLDLQNILQDMVMRKISLPFFNINLPTEFTDEDIIDFLLHHTVYGVGIANTPNKTIYRAYETIKFILACRNIFILSAQKKDLYEVFGNSNTINLFLIMEYYRIVK